MTLNQLIKELQSLRDSGVADGNEEVMLYNVSDGSRYAINSIDDCVEGCVEINFNDTGA